MHVIRAGFLHLLIFVTFMSVPTFAFAHPGHGLSTGLWHSLFHVFEALVLVFVAGLFVWSIARLKRLYSTTE